ncbi:MAG: hypothetical protein AB8B66_04830, partial [Rickettsiaceae bacterium]
IIEEQIVAAIAETIVNGATENQIQEAVAEENPVQENPVQVAEVEANPVQENPVQVAEVEANPVQENPVQAVEVEANPVQENPVQVAEVEANPVQENPVQVAEVEANPVQENPVEPELALQAEGTVMSGVDRAALAPAQQELYDLISNSRGALAVHDPNNQYIVRQLQYDVVDGIIKANPNDTREEIEQKIDLNQNIVDKVLHKQLAAQIMRFNGDIRVEDLQVGAQQGIGTGHTGAKDVSIAISLEKLRATYGILDGDNALQWTKMLVSQVIKENVPNIGNNVDVTALANGATAPTQEYQAAAKIYLDNEKPPADIVESANDKAARELRKRNAKAIIARGVQTSLSAVNNNMAAYRALYRAETAVGQVFTENVLGRYNEKEMLAYAIMANLDVREIQNNLQQAGLPLTPANIFKRQQENLQDLITELGNGQRAYNLNHGSGIIDIGGVQDLDPHGIRVVRDMVSFAHGYCTRIVNSMIHHSKVNLSDASPASLADEFNQSVQRKFRELNQGQQGQVLAWQTNAQDNINAVTVDINNDRTINFSTPIVPGQLDIPQQFKTVLTNVAAELDSRYNFTDPNHKIQIVKRPRAIQSFQNIHWIGLNE